MSADTDTHPPLALTVSSPHLAFIVCLLLGISLAPLYFGKINAPDKSDIKAMAPAIRAWTAEGRPVATRALGEDFRNTLVPVARSGRFLLITNWAEFEKLVPKIFPILLH
ncbi:MAG: hypothetical protein NTW38_12955 [Candidatus Aminicenantes bacterium]|nr:hypothetical protein [Candidatus Aminicenantes bacterium]